MKVPHAAWVAILDGEKFLLLRNDGDEGLIDLRVVTHDEIDNPPTREHGTDRPGRYPDAGQGRSAVQDTDWHALEKTRFAEEVAERLNRWAQRQRFEDLVLVADPHTLGSVRPKLHKDVRARLRGEIAKDLTHLTLEKIERSITGA